VRVGKNKSTLGEIKGKKWRDNKIEERWKMFMRIFVVWLLRVFSFKNC
jgi:hypothetical protein